MCRCLRRTRDGLALVRRWFSAQLKLARSRSRSMSRGGQVFAGVLCLLNFHHRCPQACRSGSSAPRHAPPSVHKARKVEQSNGWGTCLVLMSRWHLADSVSQSTNPSSQLPRQILLPVQDVLSLFRSAAVHIETIVDELRTVGGRSALAPQGRVAEAYAALDSSSDAYSRTHLA
ncbi:MAG: hypothetical protein ACI835_004258 [Planctomycetota bacterium]|jgi:hypothetical protein